MSASEVSTRRRNASSGIVHDMADLGVGTLCGSRLAEPWDWTDDAVTCKKCLSRMRFRDAVG